MSRKRVVILISGRGSNMTALMAAAKDEAFPAAIAGVVADRADARGIEHAERAGIPTRIVARADHPSQDAHERAIEAAIAEMGGEIVCLAGYMRLLSADMAARWEGRMLNIHPSLLPLYKGLDTHRRALADGVRLHGCTVHFVSADVDDGPIIAQAAVPVMLGDDEAALSARVLKAEHQLYPMALRLVAEGKARMENGRVTISGFVDNGDNAAAAIAAPSPLRDEVDLEQLARITP